MEQLQIFKNTEFGQVRTVKNPDGSISINAEDTAIGFGWTQTKAGKQYVKWERIQGYCNELGFSPLVGKDTYLPESIFYMLAMKANNERAFRFQKWIAMDVLPSIRKNGGYIADQEALSDDELMARALLVAQNKISEREKQITALQTEIQFKNQVIGELKPKADYTDKILKSDDLVTITQIAKDYGMSGQAMNKTLHNLGIQYSQSGQWILYSKYHNKGYTHSETVDIPLADGRTKVKMNTKWTQKGRLFLYNELKKIGIIPVIEQEDVA